MPKPAEKGPKKSYSPPQMTVYGTVRELTKQVGTHGNTDSGHVLGHTKTHV
jgi:hypothetical protein